MANIDGDNDDNVLEGTNEDDVINGLGGNDTISGLEGDDVINAGDGDDIIILNENGGDTVDGGAGFDIVRLTTNASFGSVVFVGENSIGAFTFVGGTHRNFMTNVERYEQYDFATNSLQILALQLDSADNTLDLASESVVGQAHVYGGAGDDSITAGAQYDGTTTPSSLFEVNHANFILGGSGADTLTGNVHADFIAGGEGADVLEGGDGVDTLGYRESDFGVTVDLSTDVVSGGFAEGDTISNFESVQGSTHSDFITGDDGDNLLDGFGGDDMLFGGRGNDIIVGGLGQDQMYGGDGADVFVTNSYTGQTDAIFDLENIDTLLFFQTATFVPNFISQDAFSGTATEIRYDKLGGQTQIQIDFDGDGVSDQSLFIVNGDFDFTQDFSAPLGRLLLTATQDVATPTEGDDILSGTTGDDTIDGLGGNDLIRGFAGNDTLIGGAQNDSLDGGDGNDILLGGLGVDILSGGVGNDLVLGGNRNDELHGNHGNDRVFGGNGDDDVFGDNGADIVRGGDGNDLLDGGLGDDAIFGGTGIDVIFGRDGDDIIDGRGGFDQITGGIGDDILTGGFNADRFIFQDGFGNDTITDFAATINAEKIDLAGVSEITDFADLLANHLSQSGADAIIDDGLGNTITLTGVDINDLDAVDFVF